MTKTLNKLILEVIGSKLNTEANRKEYKEETEKWMFMCDLIESLNYCATDERVNYLENLLDPED